MSPSAPRCGDAIVFVPGILGSSLVDADEDVVWGFKPKLLADILTKGGPLDRLRLPAGRPDDGIKPSGLLGSGEAAMLPDLLGISPYTEIVNFLRNEVALHRDAVMEGAYDWRRSIAESAGWLKPRMECHLERWRKHSHGSREAKLTLVCHSMGGLVARYYVDVLGGSTEVSRVLTLGTPHLGAVKALLALDSGRVLKLGLRHGHVRDLVRTLPSVYELTPRYPCVVESDGETRALEVADVVRVGGDERLARDADAVHEELEARPKAGKTEYFALRGVSQPTLQSVTFKAGGAKYDRDLAGADYTGDGTVYRRSARFGSSRPSPLPQKHGQLASTLEGRTFVWDVLVDEVGEPMGSEEGAGFETPDVVAADHGFDVRIVAKEGTRAGCLTRSAETGRVVSNRSVIVRGDEIAVEMTLPAKGLYWIEVKAGGSSAVRELVLAL